MLSKLLVITGLIIVYLTPRMLRYETEMNTTMSNKSIVSNTTSKPINSLSNIKIPKVDSLATTDQVFYLDERLEPKINNVLLVGSSGLIIAGIGLVELETIGYLIKNRVKVNYLSSFFRFIKML